MKLQYTVISTDIMMQVQNCNMKLFKLIKTCNINICVVPLFIVFEMPGILVNDGLLFFSKLTQKPSQY